MTPTIFQSLIAAIQSCQGGKTNLRTIIAPMSGNAELQAEFQRDAEADPLGFSMIETAFANADLVVGNEFPDFRPEELSYRMPESTVGKPADVVEVPPGATPEEVQAILAASVAPVVADTTLSDLVNHPQG